MKRKLVSYFLLFALLISTFGATTVVQAAEDAKIRIHYHRFDENYEGWNLWLWPEGKDGAAYTFDQMDEYGAYVEVVIPDSADVTQVGIIARLNEWEAKDVSEDRYINLAKAGNDGVVEVYLLQSDPIIYYNRDDIDLSPAFLSAALVDLTHIEFCLTVPVDLNEGFDAFTIQDNTGKIIAIKDIRDSDGDKVTSNAIVATDEELEIGKKYSLSIEGYGEIMVSMANVFGTQKFADSYTYEGNDLGATYSKESTTFKVWAPTANNVDLVLYEDGNNGPVDETYGMTIGEKGVWSVTLTGDYSGTFYNYQVSVDGQINVAVDPYAKAVGVNGERGMVVDLSTTNPANWDQDTKPAFEHFTDAIIYELHVRDLSTAENSGIANKGKFLGLTETGTKSPDGLATGLDHIKEMGITHLHLLPSFDYGSIDETQLAKDDFNWGYDPVNYNAPEGSYATDPYTGTTRILEFKQMVQTLHQNGIRVVMDVVYNHTHVGDSSNLNKIVPSYYYRTQDGTFSNGSGCGNETASERAMVRKMIVDSVVYWATEYHVDGFRFDLMGLHDIETMNAVRAALDQIDPTILIYGEGWKAGASPLSNSRSALKINASQLNGIAVFSDDIRDGIKGDVFTANVPGFANGGTGMEESVKFGIVAATEHPQVDYALVNYSKAPWASAPSQSINYVSAHDNLTLWDKIAATCPNASLEDRIKMDRLSNAIVLTSQGIPFIHAGEEMLRTKDGDENSYKSPDAINQIDWAWKSENLSTVQYYEGLIAFRKAHPALRMTTTEDIAKNLTFFGQGDAYGALQLPKENMVGYVINNNANGDTAGAICVLFNANPEAQTVSIPKGNWTVYINNEKAGDQGIETLDSNTVTVNPISALVLVSANPVDLNAVGDDVKAVDPQEQTEDKEPIEKTNENGIIPIILGVMAIVAAIIGVILFKRKK